MGFEGDTVTDRKSQCSCCSIVVMWSLLQRSFVRQALLLAVYRTEASGSSVDERRSERAELQQSNREILNENTKVSFIKATFHFGECGKLLATEEMC